MGLNFKKKFTAGAFVALAATSVIAAPTVYEAEAQAGVDAASVIEDAEYSGGKYVSVSKAMDFKVTVEETAVYDITTRVLIKQYDWTTSIIQVNGTDVGSMLTTPRNCDSSFVVTASAKMRVGKTSLLRSAMAPLALTTFRSKNTPTLYSTLMPRP
ncbi:MAG TPA: hypothetical protein PLK94_09365 [Alphaproteobacteria bacterium]|nr:hypothetical protein [Alphaproteobacteria bacterium]